MFKKLLVAAASSMIALSAFAVSADEAQNIIELKDGLRVHVFANGQMAMEDKWGRAVEMAPGQVMVAKDGKKIIMVGNEIARLGSILTRGGGD